MMRPKAQMAMICAGTITAIVGITGGFMCVADIMGIPIFVGAIMGAAILAKFLLVDLWQYVRGVNDE